MQYRRNEAVVPRASDGFTMTKFVKAVQAYPRLSSFLVLWVLLALSFLYAPAPVVVTEAMQRQFDDTMAKVPVRELRAAYIAVEQEREYVDEVRVWFWRWRPQWRVRVEERLPALEAAEARLADLVAQRDAIMAEARQVVGIWSEYAVEEARESFWSSVEAGKGVAKRATFYDAFFSMFQMRRDESIGSFLLGLLVKFVFNLTFGLLLMLVAFLVSLVGFIYTWGPGVLSGTLFFLVAGLGATAAVTGIIALVFGGLGGGLYLVAQAANDPNRRLQGGRAMPRVHYE